ncbi:MAG: CDP-alcohol phosphatidyltransferase family protein [Candidatus Omnitrophica bacterium]|nr:CDP-alcohol phosphatidyltransferase family protein [Candidatus Omnitrophota bacterium]
MNLANRITILRILLIPFFIAFILYSKWAVALIVFVIAAFTDAIDGYIARRTGQRTELGTVLDPIADKLIILSAFICFSVNRQITPALKIPLYVPIVVISRDAIIVLGAILIFLIKNSLEVKPTLISKATTCVQMLTVISILMKLAASTVLWNLAVVLTVCSGIDYVIKGSKLLNEK